MEEEIIEERNRYIRIDGGLDEILKYEINFEKYNDIDKIEDLEVVGDENVLLYCNIEDDMVDIMTYEQYERYKEINRRREDEFINIYSGVRVLITLKDTINEDKYKKLPKSIEYVIVVEDEQRYIYRNEDFEMMNFMKKETLEKYVREEIMRGARYNEYNMMGETTLNIVCRKGLDELAIELILRMNEESINRCNKKGETALISACEKEMEEVAMELIPRMSDESINICNKYGETALIIACQERMEGVAMELIPRMSEESINICNISGNTALTMACKNKMERVAIELVGRMNKDGINRENMDRDRALFWVCYYNMEETAIEIIRKMDKEEIKTEEIDYIEKNEMLRVIEMLEE
jgi:hypothetical protein